jgi:hypothetical protein
VEPRDAPFSPVDGSRIEVLERAEPLACNRVVSNHCVSILLSRPKQPACQDAAQSGYAERTTLATVVARSGPSTRRWIVEHLLVGDHELHTADRARGAWGQRQCRRWRWPRARTSSATSCCDPRPRSGVASNTTPSLAGRTDATCPSFDREARRVPGFSWTQNPRQRGRSRLSRV